MNKAKLFVILLACVALSCHRDPAPLPPNPPQPPSPADTLSAGWRKIHITDSTAVSDIFFAGDTGFYVTEHNIYRSTDGGETWQKKFSDENTTFANIGMGSSRNAIFAGSFSGKVFITTDGGENIRETMLANETIISDAFFVSPDTAYLIGHYFWKTTDAGITWTKVSNFNNTPADNYRFLFFINQDTGWATVYTRGVYKTSDGGLSWKKTTPDSLNARTGQYSSVFVLENGKGFFTTDTQLAGTINYGDSWNVFRFFRSYRYHDLHFTDTTTGYYTDSDSIFKTSDGGKSWLPEVSVPGGYIIELHFTDKNHGWACGAKGLLLKYEK